MAAERIESEKKARPRRRGCIRIYIYSPGAKPPAERDVTFRTYDALITMQFSMDRGSVHYGRQAKARAAVIANVSNTSDKIRDKARKRASGRSPASSRAAASNTTDDGDPTR